MALAQREKTGHGNSATQLQFAILTDEFRHEALDQTKFSIRLIRFIPPLDCIIQCQLWHTVLPSRLAPSTSGDLSPSYTCLSYQWKDAHERHAYERYAHERHARDRYVHEMHAYERYAHERHARERYARESHAHESHAHESHARERYAREMYVHESHAHERHAYERHAYESYA
jgi:hypothetical protein